MGPGVRGQARPVQPSRARHGGRADQPGSLDLVPRAHRRRPHAGRRHLVADRDRDDHDHAAAGRDDAQAGQRDKAFPTIDAAVYDNQGKEVPPGGGGYLVIRKPWPAMTRGIFGDPERFVETYWKRFPDTYFVGDGARVDEDGDFWLLGPGRRRDERLRPPHLDNRGGERAGLPSQGGRGRRRRPQRSPDRPGDRRLRDPEGRRRGLAGDAQGAPRPRRQDDRQVRRAFQHRFHPRSCRRRARARSCAACCGTSPRIGSWATPRHWPIPPWSTRSAAVRRPRQVRRNSPQKPERAPLNSLRGGRGRLAPTRRCCRSARARARSGAKARGPPGWFPTSSSPRSGSGRRRGTGWRRSSSSRRASTSRSSSGAAIACASSSCPSSGPGRCSRRWSPSAATSLTRRAAAARGARAQRGREPRPAAHRPAPCAGRGEGAGPVIGWAPPPTEEIEPLTYETPATAEPVAPLEHPETEWPDAVEPAPPPAAPGPTAPPQGLAAARGPGRFGGGAQADRPRPRRPAYWPGTSRRSRLQAEVPAGRGPRGADAAPAAPTPARLPVCGGGSGCGSPRGSRLRHCRAHPRDLPPRQRPCHLNRRSSSAPASCSGCSSAPACARPAPRSGCWCSSRTTCWSCAPPPASSLRPPPTSRSRRSATSASTSSAAPPRSAPTRPTPEPRTRSTHGRSSAFRS